MVDVLHAPVLQHLGGALGLKHNEVVKKGLLETEAEKDSGGLGAQRLSLS